MIVGGGHAATLAGRPDLPVVNSSNRPLEDYAVSSRSAGSTIAPLAADAEDVYVPALLARKNASPCKASHPAAMTLAGTAGTRMG